MSGTKLTAVACASVGIRNDVAMSREKVICVVLLLLAAAAICQVVTMTPEERQRAQENRDQVEREIEK